MIVARASWRGENPICQAICPATQNLNRKAHLVAGGGESEGKGLVGVSLRRGGFEKWIRGIIGEGESEIRPSNRISRGQTLSVTKPRVDIGLPMAV